MRRVLPTLVATAILAAPGAAGAACADADLVPTSENLDRIAAATFCLHNEERAEAGLEPLGWSDKLAASATAHSKDMVAERFFSHENLLGLNPFERIRAAGYDYTSAGENIAWAAGPDRPTPRSIMESWMDSPGHRENILRPEFRHVGLGIVPEAPQLLSFSTSAATYTANFGNTRETVSDEPPGDAQEIVRPLNDSGVTEGTVPSVTRSHRPRKLKRCVRKAHNRRVLWRCIRLYGPRSRF